MPMTNEITRLTQTVFKAKDITPEKYKTMKYPKLIPFMKFAVNQYELTDFGYLMTMDTVAMGGLMKLSTIVFTPSCGADVPFLLIDTMDMKKKHLAYVEYYDCTANGSQMTESEQQKTEFAAIPDYGEKAAWYVERRTSYSLIKGGENVSPDELEKMVMTCAKRYLDSALSAPRHEENLTELKRFRREMIELGNPSSDTLNKVLGADEARAFFENVVMKI